MVIVGGGFAGLKAAKGLANTNDIDVTRLGGSSAARKLGLEC